MSNQIQPSNKTFEFSFDMCHTNNIPHAFSISTNNSFVGERVQKCYSYCSW